MHDIVYIQRVPPVHSLSVRFLSIPTERRHGSVNRPPPVSRQTHILGQSRQSKHPVAMGFEPGEVRTDLRHQIRVEVEDLGQHVVHVRHGIPADERPIPEKVLDQGELSPGVLHEPRLLCLEVRAVDGHPEAETEIDELLFGKRHSYLLLWCLSIKVVLLGEVSKDGGALGELHVAVDEVWKVGEVQSQGKLHLRPFLFTERVSLVHEISILVVEKVSDGLCQTTDVPVSEGDVRHFEKEFRSASFGGLT